MKTVKLLLLTIFLSYFSFGNAKDLVFMSYNIKGHSITDTRLNNIAKVINYNVPDVVAIQEVDNRNIIGLRDDRLGYLATATSMKSKFFALVGTYYGIGLLFNTEPISIATKSFPFSDSTKDKEDRGIIIAEFDDYYFIGTHYSLNANDRDTATSYIITFARSASKPVFVAGDFNAAPTYRAMVTFKNNGFKILNDITQYTYPSDAATQCIDMILYYDATQSMKFTNSSSGIAPSNGVNIKDSSVTSDHLPVFVELTNVTSKVDEVLTDNLNINATTEGLSIAGLSEAAQVNIFTTQGSLVESLVAKDGEFNSFGNSLQKGIYIVNIKTKHESFNKKILFN